MTNFIFNIPIVYQLEVVITGFPSFYLQSITKEMTFLPIDLAEFLNQCIAQHNISLQILFMSLSL